MISKFKKLLFFSLTTIFYIQAESTHGQTIFVPRSQGANTAREITGFSNIINKLDNENSYFAFMVTPEFTRSFDAKETAKFLFFNNSNTMKFGQPPQTINTKELIDVNAWNFGLGSEFESKIEAKPLIQNFIIDLSFFFSMDSFLKGLYLQVNCPLTLTHWKMRLEESEKIAGDNYPANTLASNNILVKSAANSVIEAWKGNITFGDMKTPLKYGKIDTKDNKEFRPADIEFILGYNFLNNEKGFLGLNIRAMAPTGTKKTSEYLFGPMIGNDNWEVGIGIRGKGILWSKEDEDLELSLFFDGYISHLISKTQRRSFDFIKNGKGSRYLLLKEFNNNSYNENLVNAINVTSLNSDVKVDLQGDATALLVYKKGCASFIIGYNVWGKTKEEITLKDKITENKYGFLGIVPTNNINNSPTAGTTLGNKADGILTDIKIDGSWTQAETTPNNNLINNSKININSAQAPATISHKVIWNLEYTWLEKTKTPFLGFGGEVEICGDRNNSLNQWGIWIKSGFCY